MPAGDESDDETGDRSVLTDDLPISALRARRASWVFFSELLRARPDQPSPVGAAYETGPPARAAGTGTPVGAGYEAGDPWGG